MAAFKNKFKVLKFLERSSPGQIPLSEVLIKISLILSLIIVIPLMFPSGRSLKYSDLTVGSIASKKVIAPFTFGVLKTNEELSKERAEARDNVPFYFSKNDTINQVQMKNMESLMNFLSAAAKGYQHTPLPNRALSRQDSVVNQLFSLQHIQSEMQNKFKTAIRGDDLDKILSVFHKQQNKQLQNKLISNFQSVNSLQYININKSKILNNKIILLNKGIEEDALKSSFTDSIEILQVIGKKLSGIEYAESFTRMFSLLLHPNVEYMAELTEKRRREAVASVAPAKDLVYENERIVDANERITKDIYQKLLSLETAIAEKSEEEIQQEGRSNSSRSRCFSRYFS